LSCGGFFVVPEDVGRRRDESESVDTIIVVKLNGIRG
jgi:hypothetical protein